MGTRLVRWPHHCGARCRWRDKRETAIGLAFQDLPLTLRGMSLVFLRYRGWEIRAEDTAFIQGLIAQNPLWSRRRLSVELCRAWNWVQPNGLLRDMVCRSLLLQLHRAGLIQLPAKRCSPRNNVVERRVPDPTLPLWEGPRRCSLSELGPLEIRQVRRTAQEALFGQLMQAHHYLRYIQPVGEHLKYLVFAGSDPIAAMAWSSAPRHLAARDRFIGWQPEVRRQHLHLIAYNTRFLILPWLRVPLLASHLLGRIARRISADWQALYACFTPLDSKESPSISGLFFMFFTSIGWLQLHLQ
jgi:hypothetical protein